MTELLARIAEKKIVPVIKLDRAEDAAPLGEALIKGGLPVGEITFRTEAAEASILAMKKAFPEMLIGAGTVTTTEQAQRALDAGCSFLVTPGFSAAVTEFALTNHIGIFPGACTPSEIMQVLSYDLPVAKFFPAAQFGGLATIKALSAPFPTMKFMPTGGISAANVMEYLAFPKIPAVGGSWMVKDALIKAQDFDRIEALTREAVALVRQEAAA